MWILFLFLEHMAVGSLACVHMGPLEAVTVRSLVARKPLGPCVVLGFLSSCFHVHTLFLLSPDERRRLSY